MLRHAAASDLHEEGMSAFDLRVLLGHASVRTTQLYVAVKPDRLAAAVAGRAKRIAS